MFRMDPGLCPACDAPHCGCSPGGADTIVLLSQRDAMQAEQPQAQEPPAELLHPVPAELEPDFEPFTTASYDRKKHGPKRARR